MKIGLVAKNQLIFRNGSFKSFVINFSMTDYVIRNAIKSFHLKIVNGRLRGVSSSHIGFAVDKIALLVIVVTRSYILWQQIIIETDRINLNRKIDNHSMGLQASCNVYNGLTSKAVSY
jgi:hypothetical protein